MASTSSDGVVNAQNHTISKDDFLTVVPLEISLSMENDVKEKEVTEDTKATKRTLYHETLSMKSNHDLRTKEMSTGSIKRTRRTLRNTQRIRFPSKTSLCYRRLEQLFFSPSPCSLLLSESQCYHKKSWEKIYSEPNIYVLDQFLTTKEMDHLMEIVTKNRFQRSYVDGNDTTTQYDSTHRTSTFLSFTKQHDKTIATIEQRYADLLGTHTKALEAVQLVRYEKGQFFGIHHDLGNYDEDKDVVELPTKMTWSPRRLVTLFCYLSDCPDGGATYFPKLNLRVQPIAGRALLFPNVLQNGMPDIRTLHAGEPPTSSDGIKYGLNLWFCEEY